MDIGKSLRRLVSYNVGGPIRGTVHNSVAGLIKPAVVYPIRVTLTESAVFDTHDSISNTVLDQIDGRLWY